MNRQEREIHANKHFAECEKNYKEDTISSVNGTIVYDKVKFEKNVQESLNSQDNKTIIEVVNMTTEKAIDMLGANCCALNFASFTRPGGGFIKGSIAQEEALCHVSNLYNILKEFQFLYDDNFNDKERFNNSIYQDWALYTPNVVFMYGKYNVKANIITCACPNLRSYSEKSNDMDAFNNALKSRCKYILDIAKANNQEFLILGAFGCGVFGNDPHNVATIFKELLKDYHFTKVVFAIPEQISIPGSKFISNYQEFKKVFSE